MTSEKSSSFNYQTALYVGVPVLVGAGCCYLYYSSRKDQDDTRSQKSGTLSNKNRNEAHIVPEPKTPLEKAKSMKDIGNKHFAAKEFELAINHYTKAIELGESLQPSMKAEDLAIFYQNRAAANESLENYEKVLEDCSMAIQKNKNYTKAYRRRANAYSKMEHFDKAMVDAFSTNLLEKFQNQSDIALTESIVQSSSKAKAAEAMKTHVFDWPDDSLVRIYFSGFPTDPIQELSDGKPITRSDQLKGIYEEAQKPENENDPMSLLIQGSCLSLMGDLKNADIVLDKIINLEGCPAKIKANALMKKSILITSNLNPTSQIEKDVEAAVELLEKAKNVQPDMPDVYIHLAQAMTMLERLDEVLGYLDKAIELHPKFYSAIAQKLYLQYKISTRDSYNADSVIKRFEKAVKEYDNAVEIQQIYGQVLTELNCFEQADEVYAKIIEQDPENFNASISKTLLQFHIKSDPDEIATMLREIIKQHPKNLIAYEILGSLETQRDKRDEAIKIFETAISHAQSEPEYARCYGLLDSAKSQKLAVERLELQV